MKQLAKTIALLSLWALTLSQAFGQQFVPVLMYHHVSDIPSNVGETIVPLQRFSEQLRYLKQQGYNTITISELADYMAGKSSLPPRAIALTFDDGWKSSIMVASVLKTMNFKATFFIIGGMFEEPVYLNKRELVELSTNDNFEIGSHTMTHFLKFSEDLSKLDPGVVFEEMIMSKDVIERIIKKPVRSFAWPFEYVPLVGEALLRTAGYVSAVSGNNSLRNVSGNSPLSIGRINVSGTCDLEKFTAMLNTGLRNSCTSEETKESK